MQKHNTYDDLFPFIEESVETNLYTSKWFTVWLTTAMLQVRGEYRCIFFVKDSKFRKIWVGNLRRDCFAVIDISKLCAKHFTPDQFKIHPALAFKKKTEKIGGR